MDSRNKNNVYQSYDKMFNWYDEHRSRELFEQPYLDLAITYLQPNARILDLGCGMGEPIGKYFIDKGYKLTGIDGSAKLIGLAKRRFPQSEFIITDMRNIDLKKKFELLIVWHSMIHLSQNDQRSIFKIFESHISIKGILMFTSGHTQGEVWSDNGGQILYHASLAPEEYEKLLIEHNFDVIRYTLEDKECGNACVWLARYSR
jgi:2-polyprenyl-3-methyl-5-hydroxy-6-metoxy-1,4-benzoquinol methylase